MEKKYRVLLFYKYQTISDPENFKDEHLAFCKRIGLKGRILVGSEGINGTVSGTIEQTDKYMDYVHSLPGFEDLWFKIDEADDYAHKKIFVRVRDEIVSLDLSDDVNPLELTGKYLQPKDFHQAIQEDDTILLDTRNDYEYDLGHFKGAIRPEIRNFRELPQWVRDNKEMFMNKKVVVYCTGGVRCEKFSGWMLKEGITSDVSQLHGGIDTYGKDPEVKGDLWEGKMYVFDERISVPINHVAPSIIGKDYYDGSPCERYVNCGNPECNEQILASEANEAKYVRGCSSACRRHPRNRYIEENQISVTEWERRLNLLGESLNDRVTA
ncbi:MAG: rhodanese-related sulfurtransferase [Gallicola sp.]|nr:rhodanese-related sulfurtransferase [Gallicola sp.]